MSSSLSGPEFKIGDMRTPHFVAHTTSHAFVHALCTTVPEPCHGHAALCHGRAVPCCTALCHSCDVRRVCNVVLWSDYHLSTSSVSQCGCMRACEGLIRHPMNEE